MQRIEKEIPQTLREELESKENVVAVGKGQKRTDTGPTGEEAIVVFVQRKVPEEELDEDDIVPSTVTIQDEEEVKTDVIESGELHAQEQLSRETPGVEQMRRRGPERPEGVATEAEIEEEAVPKVAQTRRDEWRPAPGGVSVGHPEVTAGTLGSPPLVTQDNERVFLTNAHVAAPPGVERGDPVTQPGRVDGGATPEDRIGTVLEWGELSEDDVNTTDSALVKIDDNLVKHNVLGLMELSGWANARYDELYFKSGRTTGVTNGELLARDVTARINYGPSFDEPLTFEGLDVFTAMSAGGDSGSLIGRQKESGFYASDLLFAGSDKVTLGIPINTVQDEHGTLETIESSGPSSTQQQQSGLGGQSQVEEQSRREMLETPREQAIEPMGVSGVRDHFSGTLAPNSTQHWYTWGWSDEDLPQYWVVPTNPNGVIEMEMWGERASDNTMTWHFTIENKSGVYTGFQAKYVVFS